MLESLLIVLALALSVACLAIGVRGCTFGETIADVRRGGIGKPLGASLADLLRSDSGWQWFALSAALARAYPAVSPVVAQRPAAPPNGLCSGPPADPRFAFPRPSSG